MGEGGGGVANENSKKYSRPIHPTTITFNNALESVDNSEQTDKHTSIYNVCFL